MTFTGSETVISLRSAELRMLRSWAYRDTMKVDSVPPVRKENERLPFLSGRRKGWKVNVLAKLSLTAGSAPDPHSNDLDSMTEAASSAHSISTSALAFIA